jgi:hypothetical protein
MPFTTDLQQATRVRQIFRCLCCCKATLVDIGGRLESRRGFDSLQPHSFRLLCGLDWSPYTAPDLCGFPSGDWGLGACAPAQWPPLTFPRLSRFPAPRLDGLPLARREALQPYGFQRSGRGRFSRRSKVSFRIVWFPLRVSIISFPFRRE